MIYLVLSLILFAMAWYGYKTKKINKFRENLKSGDKCSIWINAKFFEAEVEDITGSVVFVVFYNDNGEVAFNNKFHITDVYPSHKRL